MKNKLIILFLLLILFISGCTNEKNIENKLKGTWYNKTDNEYILFNGDGTVYYTYYTDGEKKNVTFLSMEALTINDDFFTFQYSNKKFVLNDKIFTITDSKDINNYINVSSSLKKPKDIIEFENIEKSLNKLEYINYINEYFEFKNVPIEKTNLESKEKNIDIICQVKNVYNGSLQMNDSNCKIVGDD